MTNLGHLMSKLSAQSFIIKFYSEKSCSNKLNQIELSVGTQNILIDCDICFVAHTCKILQAI